MGNKEKNMKNKTIAIRPSKVIYRDGEKVIKQFENNYSKVNVLNEALNQALVEETNLNIPRILEITKIEDKWAIVLEFIEGKTLAQLMEENPNKLDEYLDMFVNQQIQTHIQRAPLLTKLKDKMNRKISASPLDATTRYDLHTRLEAMPKHHKICHGDFNPSNIIVQENGKVYIIDWSHVTQGNASADVARTYLLFYLDGQVEIAEKYIDLYCQKTDTAKRYIQKWIPIVAASQLVKGKPDERELLMKWVNVVDYE
jgi:thiamine kinase-like enzyme